MKDHIEVEIKTKYGRDIVYPVDRKAHLFCELLGGQLSLTEDNIKHIKSLGYQVRVKTQEKRVL